MKKYVVSTLAILNLLSGLCLAQGDTYRAAYDRGYKDGLAAGRTDQQQLNPFDFANKKAYQMANAGLDRKIHDADVYIVAYRRGFEDGYEDGYGLASSSSSPVASQPPALSDAQPPDSGTASTGELVAGTEIRVKLLETLTTRRNERGDRFRAEVIRAVEIGRQVLIPRGTQILGVITDLKRPGRIKGRAEMTLHFDQIEFDDGRRIPIQAVVASIEERSDGEVKDGEGNVEGPGSKKEDVKKVGTGAGLGALIGVLTGGGKGAKAGAIVGSIVGLAGVLTTRGDDVVLYSETEMAIRLERKANLGDNP